MPPPPRRRPVGACCGLPCLKLGVLGLDRRPPSLASSLRPVARAAAQTEARLAYVQQGNVDVRLLGSWPSLINAWLAWHSRGLQWWRCLRRRGRCRRGLAAMVPASVGLSRVAMVGGLCAALLAVCLSAPELGLSVSPLTSLRRWLGDRLAW